MVRTKADNCARKAVAAKAPRKNLGASSAATKARNSMKSPAGKRGKYGGGNSICPRPTPEWQKEITNFLICSPRSATKQKENVNPEDTTEAGCSKEDRTEAVQGSSGASSTSSTSRVEETAQPTEEEDEVEDIDEDEVEETEGSSSATSSKRKFKKNNCISDSEDDD